MWISLEILVPDKVDGVEVDFSTSEITVLQSCPPHSHREGASLWQGIFSEIGGTLFHLGDPVDIKVRNDRYYLYDALDIGKTNTKFVKFLPRYQSNFENILATLCGISKSGRVFLTLDVWLGPDPLRYRHPVTDLKLFELSKTRGLRKNSFREVFTARERKLQINKLNKLKITVT